jgi:hypothetical protein
MNLRGNPEIFFIIAHRIILQNLLVWTAVQPESSCTLLYRLFPKWGGYGNSAVHAFNDFQYLLVFSKLESAFHINELVFLVEMKNVIIPSVFFKPDKMRFLQLINIEGSCRFILKLWQN